METSDKSELVALADVTCHLQIKYVRNSIDPGVSSDARRRKSISVLSQFVYHDPSRQSPSEADFSTPPDQPYTRLRSQSHSGCVFLSPSVSNPRLRLQPLGQGVIHPWFDACKPSFALGLLLHLEDLPRFCVALQRGVEFVEGEGEIPSNRMSTTFSESFQPWHS